MKLLIEDVELLEYLARCADDSYMHQAPAALMLEDVRYFHDDVEGLPRGFVGMSPLGCKVLSFRGTKKLKDFFIDGRTRLVPFYHGNVHEGFHHVFCQVWSQVQADVEKGIPIYVTGHSLGAGVAALVSMALAVEWESVPWPGLFGCPRVGDPTFAKAFNQLLPNCVRVVHDMDLVPRIPRFWLWHPYWHFRNLLHLSDNGTIIGPVRRAPTAIGRFFGEITGLLKDGWSDIRGESIKEHGALKYIRCLKALKKRMVKEALGEGALLDYYEENPARY